MFSLGQHRHDGLSCSAMELTNVNEVRNKARSDLVGFRSQNRMVYLKVKRGGLNESSVREAVSLEEVKEFAEKIKKSKCLESLQCLRNSFCSGEEFISAFLSVSGALNSLIGTLSGGNVSLSVESCCCIINMSTGKHKTTFPILKASAPYLITFLRGSNTELQDCAAWALGNMAADCNSCRKHLKEQGFLDAVIRLLDSVDPNVLDSALFSLDCYTRFCSQDNSYLCGMGILGKIRNLLKNGQSTENSVSQLLKIIFNLTATIAVLTEYFRSEDIGSTLVNVIKNLPNQDPKNKLSITTAVIRCLGNMASSTASCGVESVVENQEIFWPFLTQSLNSEHNHQKKECLWMLSNILQEESIKSKMNLIILVPIIADISFKTLDNQIVDECLNVFIVLTTNSDDLKSEIRRYVHHLEDIYSKRPHSTKVETKINFIKSSISL